MQRFRSTYSTSFPYQIIPQQQEKNQQICYGNKYSLKKLTHRSNIGTIHKNLWNKSILFSKRQLRKRS